MSKSDPRKPPVGSPAHDPTVPLQDTIVSPPPAGVRSAAAGPRVADSAPTLARLSGDETTPSLPIFAAGDLVAGRYRIVHFVAQGGMGEVYQARDLELNENVALKTVRPELGGAGSLDRFKREIQLARKVTHPNVCRIFDVGFHQMTPEEGVVAAKIPFLTMELLTGETLSQQLARTGPMKPEDALPLVAQMALALHAAHRAGVVHSDFKSDNVVLVPSSEGEGWVRLVVTDFGLARGAAAEDRFVGAISRIEEAAGTPAYMAPEQVEGGVVSAAADIYALGVVLYEMMTGRLPFIGANPFQTAVLRLEGPPVPPRKLDPDLDPLWEQVILRCLAKSPADRFARAADIPRVLGWRGGATGMHDVGEETLRRLEMLTWRRLALLLGLVCLVGAGFGARSLYLARHRQKGGGVPAAGGRVAARRAVAVLGLKNLSGRAESAWLEVALAELVEGELAAGDEVRTIPEETIARARVELGLPEPDSLSPENLARVRKNLGADLVVSGSYLEMGGQLRVNLRLCDTRAGEPVMVVTDTAASTDLFGLVGRLAARLRQRLGARVLSREEAGAVEASLPRSPEAMRLYAEGLAQLRRYDALGAEKVLGQAAALDPDSPLVHSALSLAYENLGQDKKAQAEAKHAFDHAQGLPRQEQLLVEARYRAACQEPARAAEIYRTLFGYFPDNLEYGLHLVWAQKDAGRLKDAMATLAALRALPPPASDDARIDLGEADIADRVADFRREQVVSARAAAVAREQGARLLVAAARMGEGNALLRLGQSQKALAAYEEAKQIYGEAGHRSGVAHALNDTALLLWQKGDLPAARRLFDDALAIHRETGNQRDVAKTLHNVGIVLVNQGDLAGARKHFEQALGSYREVGDRSGAASVLQNIATVLSADGDLGGARSRLDQALAELAEMGEKGAAATVLLNLGDLETKQGELGPGRRHLQEALATFQKTGQRSSEAVALDALGEVAIWSGDTSGGRRLLEQALAEHQALGEKPLVAQSRLFLADLDLEEGRAEEAERLGCAAAEAMKAAGVQDGEAVGLGICARARARLSRPGEAQAAGDRALALAAKSQDREVRLGVEIAVERLRAAAGGAAARAAAERVEAARVEAGRLGLGRTVLEARLALAEIARAAGEKAGARARFAALERDAKDKGFLQLARRAAAGARR